MILTNDEPTGFVDEVKEERVDRKRGGGRSRDTFGCLEMGVVDENGEFYFRLGW